MAAIYQLKALDEQRAKLVEEAKTDALNRVDKAIADLNGLGFHYVLNDESEKVLQYVHDGPDGTGSMIIDRLKVLDKLRSELLETA